MLLLRRRPLLGILELRKLIHRLRRYNGHICQAKLQAWDIRDGNVRAIGLIVMVSE